MPSEVTSTTGMASFEPNNYGMKLPASFYAQDEKTFQYQEDFPALPLPKLSETMNKYLESTRPHLSEAEYYRTAQIVKDFETGVGSKLHEKLVERARNSRNWLEKWWEDYAYLFLRSPHAPYVNFGGPAPYNDTFWKAKDGTQIERGGLVIWFALKYWEALRLEALKVDRGGRRTLWCMNQFKRMFSGCKTPGKEMDQLNDYFKTDAEGRTASHVVVLSKGRFFKFDVLDADDQIITAPEIKAQLGFIKSKCEKEPRGLGLGSLTGGDRVNWFETRSHLIELSPSNEDNLLDIQKAVFCIVLDDSCPVTQSEISTEGLLGDCSNRWFDKALTFILFSNGTIACNCDHSPMDAMTMITLQNYVIGCLGDKEPATWMHAPHDAMIMVSCTYWTHIGLTQCGGIWKGPTTVRTLPVPQELAFKVDSKVEQAVSNACAVFQKNISDCEVRVGRFTGYGKNRIRKAKLHPDAFVQLALQYSYYKIHKKYAPTYETASARKFYHGRTETVRSCTMESCDFSKSMAENKLNANQKMKKLVAAIDKHNEWMAVCQEGKGCDRHMFGLAMIAMEEGIETPEIFKDPAYTKSGGGGNYTLSTSFIGYSPVYGGVLPMCDHGYGFFYCIENDRINMFCSTWRRDSDTSAEVMFETMRQSFMEIGAILDEVENAAKL